MRVVVRSGDVLDEAVDVLVCTANTGLRMSGGVNGAILQRGGEDVQRELDRFLRESGRKAVEAGTVVRTGPGPLRVKHILHAVGVTPFYESSVGLVRDLLRRALGEAAALSARTAAVPAVATGYGPLSVGEFAAALGGALDREYPPLEELRVVLRREEEAEEVRRVLAARG